MSKSRKSIRKQERKAVAARGKTEYYSSNPELFLDNGKFLDCSRECMEVDIKILRDRIDVLEKDSVSNAEELREVREELDELETDYKSLFSNQ